MSSRTGVWIWLSLLVFVSPILGGKPPLPRLVRDIRPGSQSSGPANLVVVGSRLCFTANDGVHQTEWWTSDGTESGTRIVKDLVHGGHYMVISAKERAVLDGVLYFSFVDDDAELWRTDCTAKGTYRVKDIRPGPRGSHPTNLTVVGQQLYFVANDGTRGFELWKSDGSEKGTVPVRSAGTSPALAKDTAAPDYTVSGKPNAKQKAAIAGAMSYVAETAGHGPQPEDLRAVGNHLIYRFDDGIHGSELWISDGTDAGTHLLKETLPGKDSITPWHFQTAGQRMFFRPLSSFPQLELWRTDGTADGTVRIMGFPRGWDSGGWASASSGEGVLFSLTHQGELSAHLWFSDGTEAGTKPVELKGSFSAAATDQGFFILANDKSTGSALYTLRGGVPQRVATLPSSPAEPSYMNMESVGGRLVFDEVALSKSEQGMWISDGTAEGTFRLGYFADRGKFGGRYLAAIGRRLYFTAAKTAEDVELWSVDF